MRVLLDECLPRGLKRVLAGHDVRTVPEMGWAGTRNGELLRLAEADFDVFVTIDQNLPFQQELRDLGLAVVMLAARSNRLRDLEPLVPALALMLDSIEPGSVERVSA